MTRQVPGSSLSPELWSTRQQTSILLSETSPIPAMSKLPYILLCLLTAALLGVTWLYLQSSQANLQLRSDIRMQEDTNAAQKTSIEALQVTLSERSDRIKKLSDQLGITEEKVSDLEVTNSTLDQQNESLSQKMASLNLEIGDTLTSLQGFESQIADSLDWFQANASIAELPEYTDIRTSLINNCVKIEGSSCAVRLSCLNFVNEHEAGMSYQTDLSTVGKEDQIQSLSSVLSHQGGDCEDFTQLAFAELNYLEAYCAAQGASDVRYTAFEDTTGSRHYVEASETYYINDTQDIEVDSEARFFYPVCGSFPSAWDEASLSSGASYGHCLLGFSDREILKPGDSPLFLERAILIEPQSGKLVIDLRSSGLFSIPTTELSPNPYYLSMVITDRDLYSFNALKDRYQWRGYADFASAVSELATRLTSLQR